MANWHSNCEKLFDEVVYLGRVYHYEMSEFEDSYRHSNFREYEDAIEKLVLCEIRNRGG